MFTKIGFWLKVFAVCILFLLFKLLLSYVVLSSFAKIVIDAEFDHKDKITVFYSVDTQFAKDSEMESSVFHAGKREQIVIELKNRVTSKLRLDFGSQPGKVKIYGINLTSHFGKAMYFSPEKIQEIFKPNDDVTQFALEDTYLLLSSKGHDPFLVSKKRLTLRSISFEYILPLLFSLTFFLFIHAIQYTKIPAISDLAHKTSSLGYNIASLDGIRGVAAIAVLAEHTGIANGIGSMGVYLFFALSGFLLATPFVMYPEKALSSSYMTTYLLRRLKRILPMYYTLITITMLFREKIPDALRHYLFLQGDGHLWTIPQEMFFYILLPFIVISLCFLTRCSKVLSLCFLSFLVYLANTYLTTHLISFYGYGTAIKPMAAIFMCGVLFSYIFFWFRHSTYSQLVRNRFFTIFNSAAGMVLLISLIIFTSRAFAPLKFFNPVSYSGTFAVLTGLLILFTALSENAIHTRILNSVFFRAVGLVGFSFYLLHPIALSLYKNICHNYIHIVPGAYSKFIIGGVVTYIFSIFTYSYIERPFLQKTALTETSHPTSPA